MTSIHTHRPRTNPITDDELNLLPSEGDRQSWIDSLKIGDWVFYDFELMQIIGPGTISNGSVSIGGFRREFHCTIHPMNMQVKRISDGFRFFYQQMNQKQNDINGLNWPSIHSEFITKWHRGCLGKIEHPVSWAQDFCNELELAVRSLRCHQVKGVNLFR